MDPQLRTLLRQAERAARLGKSQAAEDVYRKALEQFPDSAAAWLGLSQVAAAEDERLAARQRALALDPSLADHTEPAPAPAPVVDDSPSQQLDAALAASQNWLQQSTTVEMPARRPKEKPPAPPAPFEAAPVAAAEVEGVACFYHPGVQTQLQCNRCSKPICTRCAVKTPVGYRCKECVKEQQDIFFSALWYDYALAAVVTLPLAALGYFLVSGIGFMVIFVAPFVGMIIAEAVRLATRRRRGRWMPMVVALCVAAGSLPGIGYWLITWLGGQFGLPLWDLLWQGVYLVLAISSAYYRVK